jgi:hypothetical protein
MVYIHVYIYIYIYIYICVCMYIFTPTLTQFKIKLTINIYIIVQQVRNACLSALTDGDDEHVRSSAAMCSSALVSYMDSPAINDMLRTLCDNGNARNMCFNVIIHILISIYICIYIYIYTYIYR